MPDDIERTIYKLELDGSAYVAGVESLSASTNKFVQSQDSANKNLDAAKALQREYKEELKKTTSEIKENEKAVSRLAAANKFLQGSTSPEIRKKANDDLTTAKNRTEELKNKTVELGSKLDSVTGSIKNYNKEIKATAGHHSEISKALSKFTDLQHLAGEELSLASRRMARFGVDLAVGFGGALLGVAIPSVAKLAEKVVDLINSENKGEKQQRLYNEAIDASKGAFVSASLKVAEMEHNIELAKQGLISKTAVVKEYNDGLGKALGTAKSFNEVEDIMANKERTDAYVHMMLLRAAATLSLGKAAEKVLQVEELRRKKEDEFAKAIIDTRIGGGGTGFGGGTFNAKEFEADKKRVEEARQARKKKQVDDAKADQKEQEDIAKSFQQQADDLAKRFNIKSLPDLKPKKEKKPIQNIYEQELQKLRADIAKLDEKGFTDEATITKAIEEDFKKRSLAFEKALKNKQLTKGQLISLEKYLKDLQKLTTDSQLKNFREQRTAFLQSINDELTNLQIEESTKRISTIQNLAERERQTIISETEKTVAKTQQTRDKILADIEKNAAKHNLKPADIAPLIDQIKTTYSKLLDDLDVIKNQKLQQLAFDTFEKLSEDAKRLLDSGNLGISQGSLINIKAQTELFLQGKISFEKYQKELSEIARFEVTERFRLEKLFLEQEIKLRQVKLANDKTLTDDQIKRLEDEIRRLQQQLADAEKGNATQKKPAEKDDRLKNLQKYAEAIGAVADAVIGFWQKANDAESKALDRSISLQEKRVDAAQRIAERGNAQYLKAEQDRLTELNVKRENAARKQLGIDAALQASQILVGITGAIAKISTPGIGIAETITSIAVIIGALATGYGLVKSLQGNQPHLAEGTTYVQRGKNKYGRDTIPAMLDEGEAVTSAHKNKIYHPTIKAIHEGTIPAEQLNNFVKNFHQIKSVPQPNYDRIKSAAELHIGQDGRMQVLLTENNRKLDEHIDLQKQTIRTLKKMGVNVSLDQRGFAVTQMEVIEQMNKDKRI